MNHHHSKAFTWITGILVAISFIGLFETQAFSFVREVSEKNLKFLELVTETKLILAGISTINIPFISGHTHELESSLNKAQNFLLISDAIAFIQLMLLAMCQSWIFKAVLAVFFGLYLFGKTPHFSSKILLLLLVVSPGLPLFTAGVHALSSSAAIDFGESYQKKLEASVATIREEKSRLMMQHTQALDKIDSEDKKFKLFAKLKDDVAYDFKSTKRDVQGDFKELRVLIYDAGHEMTSKLVNFSMMVVFSFVLLPMGYALICYVAYRNVLLEPNVSNISRKGETVAT